MRKERKKEKHYGSTIIFPTIETLMIVNSPQAREAWNRGLVVPPDGRNEVTFHVSFSRKQAQN